MLAAEEYEEEKFAALIKECSMAHLSKHHKW